ncbi:MAG: peptide-methionine (R)-S-oxide reductase MsrB [Succinivibrio sp.]|nr:peptide-methionine (R)-S-oxide reductase MsrB [Succinivibrio sp.]
MVDNTIYLAGGCFWGVSEYFSRIKGVTKTECGYADSQVASPTYEQVKKGITDAVETVKVVYNSEVVSLKTLLRQFFKIIDPVSLNRQGLDTGRQYRTGIYYVSENDRLVIEEVFAEEQLKYEQSIVTEKKPLGNFYTAEDYHQDYLKKNHDGYCHTDFSSLSDLEEDAQKFIAPEKYPVPSRKELKSKLSEQAYAVTQYAATEPPHTGVYTDQKRRGLYVDVVSGAPLFTSQDKFSSSCGWPSFAKPINKTVISKHLDTSLNRERIEVKSKTSNAHLGHVFTDGPAELGGLRYCINSAALRFIPYEDLEKEGYGQFKDLIK